MRLDPLPALEVHELIGEDAQGNPGNLAFLHEREGLGSHRLDTGLLEHRAHEVGMAVQGRTIGDGGVGEGEPVVTLGDLPRAIALPQVIRSRPLEWAAPDHRACGQTPQALIVIGDLPRGLKEDDTDVEEECLGGGHGPILPRAHTSHDQITPPSGTPGPALPRPAVPPARQ